MDRALRIEHARWRTAYPHDQHGFPSTPSTRLTSLASLPRVCRVIICSTMVNRCSRRAWATVRSRMPRRRECFTAGSRPQWRRRLWRQSEARVGRPRRPSVSPRAQLFSSGVWMRWWLGPGFWLACAQPEVFCRCAFGRRCTQAEGGSVSCSLPRVVAVTRVESLVCTCVGVRPMQDIRGWARAELVSTFELRFVSGCF